MDGVGTCRCKSRAGNGSRDAGLHCCCFGCFIRFFVALDILVARDPFELEAKLGIECVYLVHTIQYLR